MVAKIWINGDTVICSSYKKIVENRAIARHEQLLLFQQCFEKQSVVDVLND